MDKTGGAAEGYVVVVGAVNVDIGGQAFSPLVWHDSNPGQIHTSLGGVGRNIAHNLRLLGADVRLVTALGGDVWAERITASCRELGIDLSAALRLPDQTTSSYLFLDGPDGEMALAVADMEIYDALTPEVLASRLEVLNGARLVLLDTNLPAASVAWLAEHCTVPLFADPVSTAKAVRLQPVLGHLHTLKPNRIEAELLSSVPVPDGPDGPDESALVRCADTLLERGLQQIFISLGAHGVYAADRSGSRVRLPCLPGGSGSATGCGDAFMAALAWAWLEGLDLAGIACAGLAAAAVTMACEQTVCPDLCPGALRYPQL